MFTLSKDRSKKGKELRMVVVETLQDMMKSDAQVVAMEADLGGASGFTKIQKSNPDRFIQCGISEANMTGVAAGLSVTGFKPYLHTFGADEVQLDWIIREFARMEGVHYIRANRKDVRNVYEKGSTFEMGKGNIVREGSDVLIISAGQLVSDALDCAEVLSKQGISVEVIDMFCIKPLDEELIIREAAGKKAVVTFENHSIIGGLVCAVAVVLADNNISVKFKRHGVKERFGAVGTPEFLQKEFRLTAEDLLQTVENTLK